MSNLTKDNIRVRVKQYLKENMKSSWRLVDITFRSDWEIGQRGTVKVHIHSSKPIICQKGNVHIYDDGHNEFSNLFGAWKMTIEEKAECKEILSITTKYGV